MAPLHDAAALRLGRLDQRYTRNRRAVVSVLSDADAPLTIPEILGASPGLAQSSTYRNLAVLEEAGVVQRIVTGDDHARFELTEELTGHHHHHLVCDGCGIVVDIALPDALEHELEKAAVNVASTSGFVLAEHRLDLVGRCTTCS
ncbi:MAG: Fur family transcriptional regulator [Actinomycetota bacterium]|nr:Fur family transcriptional regulator [Actinomycetota bacterium]